MSWPLSTPFSMKTALPVSEVEARLRGAVEAGGRFFRSPLERPVSGKVGRGWCRIYATPSPWVRNDFRRVLDAQLVSESDGTTLEGKFRLKTRVVVFLALYCGIAALGFGFGPVATLRKHGLHGLVSDWLWLAPLIFPLFAILMTVFGVAVSAGLEQGLEQELATLLDTEASSLSGMGTVPGGAWLRPRRRFAVDADGGREDNRD